MPRRTNSFQKAVKLLEQQKADYLTLTESALLRDRDTGGDREVDIVLTGRLNHHELLVSLEVRDAKRPADASWVEQMIKKHECLPTDKLILVSSSGFTGPAIRKATAHHVETVDTGEGIGGLRSLLKNAAYIRQLRLRASVMAAGAMIPLNAALGLGHTRTTPEKFVEMLMDQPGFKDILFNIEHGLKAEWRDGYSLEGVPSSEGNLLEVLLVVDETKDIPIQLSALSYGDISYVYGRIDGPKAGYFVQSVDGKSFAAEYDT